jgi:hypothetical protein
MHHRFLFGKNRHTISAVCCWKESAILNIKLNAELSQAVARQARREKTTRTAVVRSAVAAYLEEAADAADIAKRSREKSISLKQLGKRLGLEG